MDPGGFPFASEFMRSERDLRLEHSIFLGFDSERTERNRGVTEATIPECFLYSGSGVLAMARRFQDREVPTSPSVHYICLETKISQAR
jgi:hypothetical protein